jgi:Cof subfamily protein (haloacid dehalogenase superfamily)
VTGPAGRDAPPNGGASPALRHPGLVACDLDGTLLSAQLEFSPGLVDALADLRASGTLVVICTGRMFVSARRVAERLGLRDGPIICYQGGMVAELAGGEVLRHTRIEGGVAAEVVREVRALGRHLNAYVDDRLYVEDLDEWARRYAEYAEVGIEQVADLEKLVRRRPPTKFVVLSEAADVDGLVPRLQELWRDRLYVVRSQATYLEIAAPGVSKSGALAWLCERLGVSRAHTVACGDGHNDVDMLRWAGLGVAVAEAGAGVREAADVVVPRDELPALFRVLARAPAPS